MFQAAEETIDAKFTVVTGYAGGADIELAVERGEMQCHAVSIPVYLDASPIIPGAKKD
jgi:hypothetical protein